MPDPAAPVRRASTTFLVVLTALSAAADLGTKWWAKSRLTGFDAKNLGARKIEVIKDHFDFIYAMNPGGAWSFLRSMPEVLRRPFFLFISAAAIVFIVSVYARVRADQRLLKWGLPLALGGAIGNLVDRIRYGSVIDFIDVYFVRGGREHHWPTFNVADIAIVVGVALMGVDMLFGRRAPASASASEPATPGAGADPPGGGVSLLGAEPALGVASDPSLGPGSPASPPEASIARPGGLS